MSLTATVTCVPSTVQKDARFMATVTVTGDVALAEITNLALVADVAGSLNSTYFTFNSANNAAGYYVWYNINGAGVDPASEGRTGFMVAGATNASANTLATATRAAIVSADFAISGATNHVIITNTATGPAQATADGSAPTGFTITETQVGRNATPFTLATAQPQLFLTTGAPNNPSVDYGSIDVYKGNLLQMDATSAYNFDAVCHTDSGTSTYTVSAIMYDTAGNAVTVTPATISVTAVPQIDAT